LRATLITICFVLADDLHINILKFVAGHGAVVQPASINIVFGCKQAQQYSRTYHLGLSELSVGVHKMLNRIGRTCISLLQLNTSIFMHFIRSVGYSAIWYLVQVALRYKDDKYVSCTIPFFEKARNNFNATEHHACNPTPTKISIDILLPADFDPYLLLVGGGCVLSISPCWPLPTYPHRVVKAPHFEAWTRPSPKSQARTRIEPDIYFWSPIQVWKPNLARELNKRKLNLSVNDNIAECTAWDKSLRTLAQNW